MYSAVMAGTSTYLSNRMLPSHPMKALSGFSPSKATGSLKLTSCTSPDTFLLSTTFLPHVEKTTCATRTSKNQPLGTTRLSACNYYVKIEREIVYSMHD